MDWYQVIFTAFTILLGNFGIIYSFRKEIREDQKHLDNRWYAAIKSIEMECKDFHERLLEIEKKRNKNNF